MKNYIRKLLLSIKFLDTFLDWSFVFCFSIKDHPKLGKTPSWKGRSQQSPTRIITNQFNDLLSKIVPGGTQHMFGEFKSEWMNQSMNTTHILKNAVSKLQNKSHKENITLRLFFRDEKEREMERSNLFSFSFYMSTGVEDWIK